VEGRKSYFTKVWPTPIEGTVIVRAEIKKNKGGKFRKGSSYGES
jgi:hypothetical protein